MRKFSIAISLVAAALVGGSFLASSASGQTVLHMSVGPLGRVKIFDAHRDGLRIGDRIAARGPLLDDDRTERVGTSYMHCLVHRRIMDPNVGLWNCNYVLELEDGDIILQGLDPRGPGVYEMAVLGGTGAYAGAGGDATFTDITSETAEYTDIVIRYE